MTNNIIYKAPGVTNGNNHFRLRAAVHCRVQGLVGPAGWTLIGCFTLLHPGSERWLAVLRYFTRGVNADWLVHVNALARGRAKCPAVKSAAIKSDLIAAGFSGDKCRPIGSLRWLYGTVWRRGVGVTHWFSYSQVHILKHQGGSHHGWLRIDPAPNPTLRID